MLESENIVMVIVIAVALAILALVVKALAAGALLPLFAALGK